MLPKKVIKLFTSLFLMLVIALSAAVTGAAAPGDYGVFPVSPEPPAVNAVWYYITDYRGYEKHSKSFEIKITVKEEDMSLFLSFPSVGGIRLENEEPAQNPQSFEETGIFEPDSNDKISYKDGNTGKNILMTSSDGTTVKFIEENSSWKLELYDKAGVKLFNITPPQISFGLSQKKWAKARLELPLSEEEVIYGTGERFGPVNQNGTRTVMWNADAAYHSADTTGSELWRSYTNIPILHSSRGYTLFYNSFASANVDFGFTNKRKYTLNFSDSRLDAYIWTGSVKDNIVKYTDLTGKPYAPTADWAYKYQAGGSNGYWKMYGESTPNAITQLNNLYASYEEMGTPVHVVYGEHPTISASSVGNNIVKGNGSVMLRWNNGDFVSPSEALNYISEVKQDKLPFVRYARSKKFVNNWVDYTDPMGTVLLKRWLRQYTDLGIKGGMCDFAELIPSATIFANGLGGDKMHNFYTYFYAKAYNQAYTELTNDNFLCYIRGACAGAQRWSPVWLGDQSASRSGLEMQVRSLISLSASGYSMIGADIAALDGTPSDYLYRRWLQFATFMPIMRSGGNSSKNPTDYNVQTQAAYKNAYWLRESIADKVQSSAIKANITGIPMTQAMGIAFDGQLDLYNIEDQYLFCDDFLVSVVYDDVLTKEVTLPTGNWYNLFDGKKVSGAGKTVVETPYNYSPVFIRSGTAAPVSVDRNMDIMKSDKDSEKVKALLVTPADKKRTEVYHADKQSTTVYTNEPINENTFRISYDKGNEAENLLAYGVSAYGVSVDGKALKKLERIPTDGKTAGYYLESESVTKIYIGNSDWKNVDITLGDYGEVNLLESFTDHEANVLLTSDNSTFYNINDPLTAVLKKSATVNSVTLKWLSSYADGYTISVSEDGNVWKDVKTVEGAAGGIETVAFEPVRAKYVKVTVNSVSGGAQATIYQMLVNKCLYTELAETVDNYKPVTDDDGNTSYVDSDDDETTDIDEDDEIRVLKRRKLIKKGKNTILGLSPVVFFIILGAVILVAAGVAVFIIILIKKKRKKTNQTA